MAEVFEPWKGVKKPAPYLTRKMDSKSQRGSSEVGLSESRCVALRSLSSGEMVSSYDDRNA